MHKVYAFSEHRFACLLANIETDIAEIKEKPLFNYCCRYLKRLRVSHIVVEQQYTSADFLNDYSSYYSDCHKNYEKICKRLHFFSSDPRYGKSTLLKAFSNTECKRKLKRDYLGYLVVKPIPNYVIGFTILKTYSSNKTNKRSYWGTRPYKANLLGLELPIMALAFQEQDTTLSACATISIWAMLHKAAENYFIKLRTPGEITKDAGIISHNGNRLLPNKEGLLISEMCTVIAKSGLQPETRIISSTINSSNSSRYVKQLVQAYSGLGIPLIMTIEIPDEENQVNSNSQHEPSTVGHAITVVGHKIEKCPLKPPRKEITWHSDKLKVLYAHDDQVGPYSYVVLLENNKIKTDWEKDKPEDDDIQTTISSLILPVYPDIKVSFDDIEPIVCGLDSLLSISFGSTFHYDIEWDLQLIPSEDFKRNNVSKAPLSDNYKNRILSRNLPKYIWNCRCIIGEFVLFEIIFDATSIPSSDLALETIVHYNFAHDALKDAILKNKHQGHEFFQFKGGRAFFKYLITVFE
ncbi:hypothetical protein KJS94_12495 [Flavihumibacter rivuli]|uniref:hypothetical protein n=1 Tax=Flavihumibacter rivuli TaxID=2838156 RepID=UPI001BDF57DA|nr:hypothetical protein [Flavihumibacter rivuli]ULQ55462.1 hypothetical protein KJS94_12495 [Flavihumibacter rivuli]